MSKKRSDEEYMICFSPKPTQSFFVFCIEKNEKKFIEKEIFKKKGEWRIEQNRKEGF